MLGMEVYRMDEEFPFNTLEANVYQRMHGAEMIACTHLPTIFKPLWTSSPRIRIATACLVA